MRDYDKERLERHAEREKLLGDREFKVGGEVFIFKANVAVDVLRRLTSDTPLTGAAYIDAIEASCLEMIEDEGDAHDRFHEILTRADDPVTMEDLQIVFTGLVEDAFRRPTEASSPSTDGDAPTGTGSTETSSTEPAEASAA